MSIEVFVATTSAWHTCKLLSDAAYFAGVNTHYGRVLFFGNTPGTALWNSEALNASAALES